MVARECLCSSEVGEISKTDDDVSLVVEVGLEVVKGKDLYLDGSVSDESMIATVCDCGLREIRRHSCHLPCCTFHEIRFGRHKESSDQIMNSSRLTDVLLVVHEEVYVFASDIWFRKSLVVHESG